MNDNDRFYPAVQTPVGKVLLIGATMTVEREREPVSYTHLTLPTKA